MNGLEVVELIPQGTLAELSEVAGVPWSAEAIEPPIERIYRVLVARGRAVGPRLTLVRGSAA